MTAAMSPQETVERALALSRADGCIVIATERTEANLRWAGNTLTTNGEMRSRDVAVISIVHGKTGVASGVTERTVSSVDELAELVRASEKAAHDAGPADDAMPLVELAASSAAKADWENEPAETSITIFQRFSQELRTACQRAISDNRQLFGFAEHVMTTTYLGTSTGIRLRHDQPTGRLEINAKSGDLSKSAWHGATTNDFTDINMAALDDSLIQRLQWAQRSIELPPGRYETLLPPSSVADLMIYLYWSASARDSDEGSTVFSKKGGGSRIGERLTDLPLTLYSDPQAPGLSCLPFEAVTASHAMASVFDNGLPTSLTRWIDNGVLNSLIRTRSWAQRSGGQATPGIDNLILETPDGVASLDDMVASTERGLLLTCLWYIREVDPQTLLLTGLTRDGVYLVEQGEVVGEVNNFRFNESPVDLLSRISESSRTERTLPREWSDFFTRAAMPAIRVPDFNMSTVSQAM